MLAGERFDFEGRFHELSDTWLSPIHHHAEGPLRGSEEDPWLDEKWRAEPSVPAVIPLMAGSIRSRMLQIMLPHVAGWNVHWIHPRFWNIPERFPDIVESVSEHAVGADRDPSELWSSAEIYMTFPGSRGLPVDLPDGLAPLPADVETLARCEVAAPGVPNELNDPYQECKFGRSAGCLVSTATHEIVLKANYE